MRSPKSPSPIDRRRRRFLPRTWLGLVGVGALAAVAVTTVAEEADAAPSCGTFFDDFTYSDGNDPGLALQGWQLRSGGGGPGVGGPAGWSADQISFVYSDGHRSARLTARTDGTSQGTVQAELTQREFRFREGTYAARIRFSDTPTSGTGSARPNQTFYALSPLRYDFDPLYSELDFAEYLSRGGWGSDGPTLFTTSYHTYQADPWEAQNASSARPGSIEGWHIVSATATNGVVRYFLDGQEVAVHDQNSSPWDVFPRSDMVLAFNHWFIDLGSGGPVEYQQDVDWVFYEAGAEVAFDEVMNRVDANRATANRREDSLREC